MYADSVKSIDFIAIGMQMTKHKMKRKSKRKKKQSFLCVSKIKIEK